MVTWENGGPWVVRVQNHLGQPSRVFWGEGHLAAFLPPSLSHRPGALETASAAEDPQGSWGWQLATVCTLNQFSQSAFLFLIREFKPWQLLLLHTPCIKTSTMSTKSLLSFLFLHPNYSCLNGTTLDDWRTSLLFSWLMSSIPCPKMLLE